jgi:hypothetical protein
MTGGAPNAGVVDRHERAIRVAAVAIREHYGPRLVSLALFGSAARGTARPDSDLDLFIVATGLPRGRVARMAEFEGVEQRVTEALPDPPYLSPVIKTPEELSAGTPLLFDMTEDARILVDRGGVLATRLERLATRMRELGSRRIWRDGWWYWDLKPDFRPGEVFEL